jgi:hypothetical protein
MMASAGQDCSRNWFEGDRMAERSIVGSLESADRNLEMKVLRPGKFAVGNREDETAVIGLTSLGQVR